jgi:hypothetical protein
LFLCSTPHKVVGTPARKKVVIYSGPVFFGPPALPLPVVGEGAFFQIDREFTTAYFVKAVLPCAVPT